MHIIFFDTWDSLIRTAVIGLFSYVGLVVMLRVSGSRTLSQLNAFDLIVTVALGSTLATVLLNKNVALADGLLAMGLLILCQYAVSRTSIHFEAIRAVIKTEPRMLFYKGEYIMEALKDCRITKEEIIQVVRSEGIGDLSEVDAVVLETNGKFSVTKTAGRSNTALQNVK